VRIAKKKRKKKKGKKKIKKKRHLSIFIFFYAFFVNSMRRTKAVAGSQREEAEHRATNKFVPQTFECCVTLEISSEKPHRQPPRAQPPLPISPNNLCFPKTLCQNTTTNNKSCNKVGLVDMFPARPRARACRYGEERRRWARRV